MDDFHLRQDSPLAALPGCGLVGAQGTGCDQATPALVTRFSVERVSYGAQIDWQLAQVSELQDVGLERAESREGPWRTLRSALPSSGMEVDRSARSDRPYWYRLVETLGTGALPLGEPIVLHPSLRPDLTLTVISANPGSGATSIEFGVGRAQDITLTIHDLQGRRVSTLVDGRREPGVYTLEWLPTSIHSGVYLVRARSLDGEVVRRITVLR
jgi:hypothetical protein